MLYLSQDYLLIYLPRLLSYQDKSQDILSQAPNGSQTSSGHLTETELRPYRVSEEKDARGYLQALASKMTEELEVLKMSGGSAPAAVCITHYGGLPGR